MSITQNGSLARDDNDYPVMGGTSSADGTTIVNSAYDPVTRALLVTDAGAGIGTVTSFSFTDGNGFDGTVTNPTTTPALSLAITASGVLKGSGGAIEPAVANTDYQIPIVLTTTGTSGAATFDGETLNIPDYASGGGTVETISIATANGFAGTSDGDPTDPQLTIETTVAGVLVGDGTGVSALGYTPENVANKATDFSTINNTLYPTVQAVNTAITNAVTGLLDYRGSYDASSNLFPSTGGSGPVGAILKGDFWICSVSGTLGGTAVTPGDLIIAIVDTPGQTASNWDLIAHDLGSYVTSVTGTSNRITSTGGSTPVIDIAATYVGQSSITTVGTLSSGAVPASLITAGTFGSGSYSFGTGNAVTLGTIELGNASDTTLSRAGAGDLAVEGVSVLTTSNAKTVTNKRNQPRTASSTTASTLTPDLSSANVYYRTTQTASLTINAPTGTPVIGEVITIYVDSAGAQTLTINSTYKVFGTAFPATTTAGKTFMMQAQYNGTDWKTTWANAV